MFPTKEHIDAAVESAEQWYQRTGVYSFPSFRLAQTAIESANGTALTGDNNYWGVKANKDQIAAGQFKECPTHEVIHGQRVPVLAKFASYVTLLDGYMQQAKLLVTSSYYKESRHDTNPKQYAIDVAVHYATDPHYAKTIIGYMDQHNLYQYDHPAHRPDPVHEEAAPLQPPAHLQKQAQAPAVTGAVVMTGALVTAASTHGAYGGIIVAGVVIALVCAGIAFVKYRQAHKVLAEILAPTPVAEQPSTASGSNPAAVVAAILPSVI